MSDTKLNYFHAKPKSCCSSGLTVALKEDCNLKGIPWWAPSALPTPAAALFIKVEATVSGPTCLHLTFLGKAKRCAGRKGLLNCSIIFPYVPESSLSNVSCYASTSVLVLFFSCSQGYNLHLIPSVCLPQQRTWQEISFFSLRWKV